VLSLRQKNFATLNSPAGEVRELEILRRKDTYLDTEVNGFVWSVGPDSDTP